MLEKEYTFWMSTTDGTGGHAIEVNGKNGETFRLNRYTVRVSSVSDEAAQADTSAGIRTAA